VNLTGYQDDATTSPGGASKQLFIVRYCKHSGGGANLQSGFVVDGTGTERRVVGVAVKDNGDRPVEAQVQEWIRASEHRTNRLDQSSGRENDGKGGEATVNLMSWVVCRMVSARAAGGFSRGRMRLTLLDFLAG